MRPSQKNNRNRGNKNNRNKSMGNVSNRVFDSAGPEGKVRGTPQQIVDKYEQLARDASLSGDRVMAENFLQHAEHYARLLSASQGEDRQDRGQQNQPRDDQRAEAGNGDGGGNARGDGNARNDGGNGGGRQDKQDRQDKQGRQGGDQRPQRGDRRDQPQPELRPEQQDQPEEHRPAPIEASADPAPAAESFAVQEQEEEGGLVETPEEEAAAKPRRRRAPRRKVEKAEGDAPAEAEQPAPVAASGEEGADEGVRRTAARGRRRTAKPKADAPAGETDGKSKEAAAG